MIIPSADDVTLKPSDTEYIAVASSIRIDSLLVAIQNADHVSASVRLTLPDAVKMATELLRITQPGSIIVRGNDR